jgi:hypothetical protein
LEGDVLRRVWLVVVLAGIAGASLPGAASAAPPAPQATWEQAAATVRFPIWRPGETLGLQPTGLALYPCTAPPTPRSYLSAGWGTARRGFGIMEVYPQPCGNAGEARRVRTAVVGGVTVSVLVYCRSRSCRVTAADGVEHGFLMYFREPGAKRTQLQLDSHGMTLAGLFKVIRSFAKVPATGDLVQYPELLSPDRQVWCRIDPSGDAWCASKGRPAHGGTLTRDGTVTLCDADLCTQNWPSHAPVLPAGKRSEIGGYRCAAGADAAITCTLIATGQGFVVGTAAPARQVGPGSTAATPSARAARAPEHVQRAHLGAVRAQYSYDGTPIFTRHARIRIWNGAKLIVDRSAALFGPGYARLGARRALAIRQLDGTGPPEVVLTLYSGGAHCCWEAWIFTGAHRVRQGWGHGLPVLRDADGDGRPEFHGPDTSFAYAFGSFGSSRFPAEVWSYAGGAVTNVSAAFPDEIRADQATQHAAYVTARDARAADGVRAALAAYAADGYRLGQGDQAMAVVQAAVAAGEVDTDRDDPDGFWAPDYLGTLRTLLQRLGYA